MCGISGFNWKDEERIEKMVRTLSHRGPDARGVFTDEGVSLGHDRLSVIDLSAAANQPMHGEGLVIVFNGEIYNFKELRAELEGSYPFRTKSDTEVILAGYRKWGAGVAERLNGMFAFAIWDEREKILFCARDHAGMKPFYYYWDGKRFIFASEIPAILEHDVPRRLNKEAFNHYLRVLNTPEPLTLIEGISKLPASHSLTLKGDALSIRPYGRARESRTGLSYGEACEAVRGAVERAVKRHLVADVPVGVYLSGGIDSSIVLAAASRTHPKLKTFTVGFDLADSEEAQKFNEDFALAKRTADFFGTEHTGVRLSTSGALALLEPVAGHNSDPVSNPTSLAMFLLARTTKKEVSVVLTGNGGDELFGGYDRYRLSVAAHYYRALPSFLRSLGNLHPRVRKLDTTDAELFAQFMFQKDDRLAELLTPGILAPALDIRAHYERYLGAGDSAERLMRADRRAWLPEHFFMLSDHMSMASALEERMPLLDMEVKALAEALPRDYKVDLRRTKKVLKDAFRKELPAYLFEQPKRGWFSPAAKWLRDPAFGNFAREVLSESYYAGTRSLFNWSAVGEALDKHISKDRYNLSVLWAILTFQMWARQHKIEL